MKRARTRLSRGWTLLAFAIAGWAYCGLLIGLGRQVLSMQTTLLVHAIGAPVGFAALSLRYHRRFADARPWLTAAQFLAVVVLLDLLVVALLIERSLAMFTSPIGTWIPFVFIFAATGISGNAARRGNGRVPDRR